MDPTMALRELHRGVTFGFYARNGYYASEAARDEVRAMAETGVKWVTLVVTVMQEGFAATRQFRDFVNTPDDLELKEIIDCIHENGMKVHLRPMLECFDGKGRLAVNFPQDDDGRIPGLRCDYAARWFDSMEKRSAYYARIARKTGCDMYCLDSELDRMIDFNAQWKRVLQAVRREYSGPVTSSHTIHCGAIDFERVLQNKQHWFYDLDMLLISDYTPCAQRPGLSATEMAENMKCHRQELRTLAQIYQKPIAFGECGCTSSTGGAMYPSGWSGDGGFDGGEQANYLQALLETYWHEDWWYGLYWWKWDEQNVRPQFRSDPAGDKGFVLRGKPAQQVMQTWFQRSDVSR